MRNEKKQIVSTDSRICRTCGKEKSLKAFPLAGGGYRRKDCKRCWVVEQTREQMERRFIARMAGEPGLVLEALRKIREADPEVGRLEHVGSTWDLTIRWLENRVGRPVEGRVSMPAPRTVKEASRVTGVVLSKAGGQLREQPEDMVEPGVSGVETGGTLYGELRPEAE